MKEEILEFLKDTNTKEDLKLEFIPLDKLATILSECGLNTIEDSALNLDEFEINGWQVDFWWKLTSSTSDKNYTLSGSLFYGDFTLGVNEEEDDE